MDQSKPKFPRLRQVVDAICYMNDIELHELMSNRREKRIVDARFIYYWIATKCCDKSYSEIGRFINKDHSTVMHGFKKTKHKFLDPQWSKQLHKTVTYLGLPERTVK